MPEERDSPLLHLADHGKCLRQQVLARLIVPNGLRMR
jgi:hypothetical protein